MGRRLGLIIGINSYQDTTFRSLQFAETDARALAQWLVNNKGGNWSPADVQLVQGTHATRELIESLITQMCVNIAGPGDLVLIYFGGHAFLDAKSGEGYLALANTQYQQPSTGLHLLSLARQAIGNSRAAHIVFMLDCFQTGQHWSLRRSSPYDFKLLLGPTILHALQQMGNRIFFCSCRGNDLAPEAGEKNLGLLAYRMILGLCGPASDPVTGQITLPSLYAFLWNTLGEQQRPQLFGQEQSPLLLIGDMPPPPGSSTVVPNYPNSQSVTPGPVMTQAPSPAVATAQLSPTTPAQFALSPAEQQHEQQCIMLLRQARQFIQMQNPGAAFNSVEQALQLAPTNIPALILKGQLLGTAGRFQEAMSVVKQVLQLDANNALAWSMCAALLTNLGRYQEALRAVERSLELDPNNPETYSIKTSITDHLAVAQSRANNQRTTADTPQKHDGSVSLFIWTGIQFLGLLLVLLGIGTSLLLASLPSFIAIAIASLGLALLCVNAARGSYLYGFARFILAVVISALAGAILGGLYKFGFTRILHMVKDHPSLLVPVLFLGLCLALAAVLPPVLALGGLIAGLALGRRNQPG